MKKRSVLYKMIPVYFLIAVLLFAIAQGGSHAVSTFAENQPIDSNFCIVIDPGHGGVDGGATSCSGALESQINLQIALRLNDLLHLLGIRTVMIRDTDRSIHTQGTTIAQKKVSDLKERVRIVNNIDQALLVSIHQNYYTDNRYYGPQVFYGVQQESKVFANDLQTVLNETLCPQSNRKVKSAKGIYLMEQATCTAVLIECGFLSNPAEDKKLSTPDYQRQLCCVIASVCSQYCNNNMLS